MDIHKPRPWHGAREFLKEYGIIVLGVLTALGAEAVVQNLHEQRLSAEARAAVLDEINVDITNYAMRLQAEPCVARRLEEIGRLLDAAEDGKGYVAPTFMGGPPNPALSMSRWDAATAGGRTSLLSSQEQRQFGNVYRELEHVQQRQEEEYQTWLTLRALVGLRHPSQGMIDQQRLALARARNLDGNVIYAFGSAKIYAQRLGVKGDAKLAPARGMTRDFPICRPMTDAPKATADRPDK